nr:hypothetical protein [Tanacetum cinerariifolium]
MSLVSESKLIMRPIPTESEGLKLVSVDCDLRKILGDLGFFHGRSKMGFAATGEPTNEGWFVGGEGDEGGFMEWCQRGSEKVKGVVVMTWPNKRPSMSPEEVVKRWSKEASVGTGDLDLVDG